MFDERQFTDRYNLYRPTATKSATGTQTISDPDEATASDQPCLFFPAGRQPFSVGPRGVDVEFDAVLYVPASAALKPEARAENPDVVYTDGRYWVVQKAWDAAGKGSYKVVLLTERNS